MKPVSSRLEGAPIYVNSNRLNVKSARDSDCSNQWWIWGTRVSPDRRILLRFRRPYANERALFIGNQFAGHGMQRPIHANVFFEFESCQLDAFVDEFPIREERKSTRWKPTTVEVQQEDF